MNYMACNSYLFKTVVYFFFKKYLWKTWQHKSLTDPLGQDSDQTDDEPKLIASAGFKTCWETECQKKGGSEICLCSSAFATQTNQIENRKLPT